MKTRDIYVGRQHIEEFCFGWDADKHAKMSLRVDDFWMYDMTFDEAVLRAANGEQLAPCPF